MAFHGYCLTTLFGKSAGDGFAVAGNAVAVSAAMGAAGLVHLGNHAGFEQSARGEIRIKRKIKIRIRTPALARLPPSLGAFPFARSYGGTSRRDGLAGRVGAARP
jgi:hypothetical protein